jgi:hypothetical protein
MERVRITTNQSDRGTAKSLRRPYQSPEIETISLDSEISLILESTPAAPGYSPSWTSKADDASVNDPFKTNLG